MCVTTSAQFVKFKAIGVDRTAQKVSRLLEWLCCTAAAGVAASAGGCAVCHQCSRKPIAFGCGAAVAGLAAYHYFVAGGGAGVAATAAGWAAADNDAVLMVCECVVVTVLPVAILMLILVA